MMIALLPLFLLVLPALALPPVEVGEVTTVVVKKTTTICPSPRPPPPTYTRHHPGGSRSIHPYSRTSIVSSPTRSPTPGAADKSLVEKRGWDVNGLDLGHLEPKKYCRMLYVKDEVVSGTKPAEGEPYAWVTMNETAFPVIQTVNSQYMQKVSCDIKAGWIKMQFSSQDAYHYAWDSWHHKARPAMGDYVVVTPESTCTNWNSTQERYFLRARSEERDDSSKTITCKVEDISLTETIGADKAMDINFNNFNQKTGVNAQADATANGGRNVTDGGGEVLGDPSGDSDYDEYIDALIGRMELATLNQTLSQYNLTLDDFYWISDLPDLATESLVGAAPRKRSLRSKIKTAFKKVASGVVDAAQTVGSAIKTAADAIVGAANTGATALAGFTTVDGSLTTTVDFDSTKSGDIVTTPFHGKPGYQLLSLKVDQGIADKVSVKASIDVFCVECGVQGDFKLNGQLSFIVSQLKFKSGSIDVSGAMHAGLGLGVVAEAALNRDFSKRIATIPLSPFEVPGVVIVGPEFTLDIGVSLALGVAGSVQAGVAADWTNIQAHIDIGDGGRSSVTGFKPAVTPVFDIAGAISLTTTYFLEGGLGIGLDLLNGAFDKSVALVDRPGVFCSAGLGAGFNINSTAPASTCNGLNLAVGFTNEVSVKIFDATSIPLDDQSVALESQCLAFSSRRSSPALLPELPALPALWPASKRGRGLHSRQEDDDNTEIDAGDIGNSTFDDGIMAELYTRDVGNPNGNSNSTDPGLRLRYSPNGNIYAVHLDKQNNNKEWSGWFAADVSGAFVVGDSHGRFFHAYTDTLTSLGVSRLRLHAPDQMPRTGQPIVLAAATLPNNSTASALPYMIASDLGGNIYFPIVCVYDNGAVYPKMFLANNTDVGVATLMSNAPDIRQRVTGAAIKTCGYVPLTNGIVGVDLAQIVAA